MKIIGITGQTGAGKSTVSKELIKNGFYHIDADVVAKEVINRNGKVKKELRKAFGDDVIKADGTTDRQILSKRAFSSTDNAKKLSDITHPAVVEEIKNIIEAEKKNGSVGVLIDAIGLFESGLANLCQFNICVTAPTEIRLNRIVKRDNISREKALERINAQHSEDYFIQKSDIVVENGLNKDLTTEIQRILNYEKEA